MPTQADFCYVEAVSTAVVIIKGSQDEVHAQPLVGLALVSLLHVCADAYVSAELPGHAQAAGQHARHLSNVLMRLRASVGTAPELSSDLQVLTPPHLSSVAF